MKRDLKADLELCNKATPEPWKADHRTGSVAVYPESIGHINCFSALKKEDTIFFADGYPVRDSNGKFVCWHVREEDRCNADLIAQAREGWPHAIERAIKAETLARELAEALQLYENWEAKVIMDDSLWQSASGLPFITQEVWDDLVAIQGERNKVLHKAKEVLNDEA